MKKLLLIILLSINITIGLAQETQNIDISEANINEALDRFLEGNDRNFDIEVKLFEGQISIFLIPENASFNFEEIIWTIVPTMQEGRVIWTLATWEATDTDGNLILSNPRIQSLTPNIMNIWGQTLRSIVRDETTENTISISYIQVSTGVITVQIDHQLTSANDNELPPNAIENVDGSISVNISEDMMNQSLQAVQNRYEAIDSMSVNLSSNTLNFTIEIERICDIPVDVQYNLRDNSVMINTNFEINDWNGDGIDELAIQVMPSDNEESFYTIELVNAFCQGESVSAQQSTRINTLILPTIQRFLQLQSCDSPITNLEISERNIILILPQYTTCLTTHL